MVKNNHVALHLWSKETDFDKLGTTVCLNKLETTVCLNKLGTTVCLNKLAT